MLPSFKNFPLLPHAIESTTGQGPNTHFRSNTNTIQPDQVQIKICCFSRSQFKYNFRYKYIAILYSTTIQIHCNFLMRFKYMAQVSVLIQVYHSEYNLYKLWHIFFKKTAIMLLDQQSCVCAKYVYLMFPFGFCHLYNLHVL